MTGMWITTRSLALFILITGTCALPLQRPAGVDQDSDEADSEEEENATKGQQSQNVTDQELTNKATQFLTKYFYNHGTEAPLHIPTNLNHTIVITIVPNDSPQAFVAAETNTEGPPTFGGDIPLVPLQQQQQQQVQYALQSSFQQHPQDLNLTPIKNLVGFVPSNRLPSVVAREEIAKVGFAASSTFPTITEEALHTQVTTSTPSPRVQEQPVDNIEDAILEALSIAGGEGGQGNHGSPPSPPSSQPSNSANQNYQALVASGAIPGLANNNNGIIKVPSNFGPVFIEAQEQATTAYNGAMSTDKSTPSPTPTQAATASAVLQPNVVFLQPTDAERRPQPIPSTAHAFKAVSGIIGSISEGNLGGLVQNTIKLAETPVLQNTAKLATVAILHNVFQGLNPCNLLGNCGQRPQSQGKK